MGTVGDNYDNAMAASFFSEFKWEVIDGEHFAIRADARKEIVTWLNWYNRTRLHSSIGYGPAVQFGRADLPVHVRRDLPVMIGAERPWQLGLHGLRPATRAESSRACCRKSAS
jgi:hypothetical protein